MTPCAGPLLEQGVGSPRPDFAVARRLRDPFQARDQLGELPRHRASILDGAVNASCIDGVTATVTRDLALDELAEPDTDRGRAERRAVRRPRLVAHLDSRHPIPRRPSARLNLLLPLPSSTSHSYTR